MEGSSLKTISLELKKNLMGTLGINVTQSPHPQTQPSPLTQQSSEDTRLMEHQMSIRLETCKSMITASKALAQDISENTKGRHKKIPSIYKKMRFTINSKDGDIPADKIRTQGI